MNQTPIIILAGIIGMFFVFWIFKYPYLGIAFTGASLAIVELLPPIPYLSSFVPLVGGLTLVAYLVQKREVAQSTFFNFNTMHLIGLLFVVWVFVSSPQAAWMGTRRNWVLTYLQLLVLMYLATELLNTPQKHQVVMVVFSVFSIISAFYAIQSGFIGETFAVSIRAEGFVDNANAAARYFVVAMVFLFYLRSVAKNPLLKLFCLLGIVITYIGVFYTVSRTGMILLFAAQGLILIFQTKGRQRVSLIFIFSAALVLIWFTAENIFNIIETIIPIIINREDTFGLRINLWRAGWLMWLDYPVQGVGIGRYIEELGPYMLRLEGPRRWNAVAHNTYVQVLSETGIIGFILFMSMIITTLKHLWGTGLKDDVDRLTLRNTWLVAFLVMLLGGITKSDHADKLTWMVMGLSLYFAQQGQVEETAALPEESPRMSARRALMRSRYQQYRG